MVSAEDQRAQVVPPRTRSENLQGLPNISRGEGNQARLVALSGVAANAIASVELSGKLISPGQLSFSALRKVLTSAFPKYSQYIEFTESADYPPIVERTLTAYVSQHVQDALRARSRAETTQVFNALVLARLAVSGVPSGRINAAFRTDMGWQGAVANIGTTLGNIKGIVAIEQILAGERPQSIWRDVTEGEILTRSRQIPSPPDQWDETSWCKYALCVGLPTQLFYPSSSKHPPIAAFACANCPVRPECKSEAMGRKNEHGIWGGATSEDRAAERRMQKSRTPRNNNKC